MTKLKRAFIKQVIILLCIIFLVLLYLFILKIKNIKELILESYTNTSITEFNLNDNKKNYRSKVDTSNQNKLVLHLTNGEKKEFINDIRKFGENSFRPKEIYKAVAVINKYLLLDMYLGVMSDTVFVDLDNGDVLINIPSCKVLDEQHFNKSKTMFYCANYDKTNFSESGISIFTFENDNLKLIYDKEQRLDYKNIKWLDNDTLEINFLFKNKLEKYFIKCPNNVCARVNSLQELNSSN